MMANAPTWADDVASITSDGTTTNYATLQAAFDAVTDGQTITLLNDASGDGVVIADDSPKSVTLDLNSKTYTVSTTKKVGNNTVAFYVGKGSTVTVKGGTLTYAKWYPTISNYGTLILSDATVSNTSTFGGCGVGNYDGSLKTEGTTTISGINSINVYYVSVGSTVNIGDNTTISGVIWYGSSASKTGTDWVDNNKIIFADNYDISQLRFYPNYAGNELPNIQKADGTSLKDKIIIKSLSYYYTSLQTAFDNIPTNRNGSPTLTLLRDVEGNGATIAEKSGSTKYSTIDLNGHTYTVNGTLVGSNNDRAFVFESGAQLTLKNGTLKSSNAAVLLDNCADLTLDGVTLDGSSLTGDNKITLAVQNGNVTVNDGTTIDGNIEVTKTGDATTMLTIYGGTFKNFAITSASTTDAITVKGGNYSAEVDSKYLATGYTCSQNASGTYDIAHSSLATIGTTTYATLADAVAAVPTDGTQTTITLTGDATGEGAEVKSGQNVVFDLAGYTYNVDNSGASETKTYGFQLQSGATVEFKDGKLESATAETLLQNYSALTLTDVTLDESGHSNIGCVVYNGYGSLTTAGTTTIKAATGKVAFNLYYGESSDYDTGVSVTIANNTTVSGNVEYGAADRITTTDWTDKATLTIGDKVSIYYTTFVASSSHNVLPNVKRASSETYLLNAQNGSVYYETLQKAISASPNGSSTASTVKLLTDCSVMADIYRKNIVLDLNGHTIKTTSSNAAVNVTGGSTVTIKNGTLSAPSITKNGKTSSGNGIYIKDNKTYGGCTVTVEDNVTVDMPDQNSYAVYISGNANQLTINGGTFKSPTYGVAYVGSNNTITVNGGTIEANMGISGNGTSGYSGNTININGGTITAKADDTNGGAQGMYFPNNDSVNITKCDITVEGTGQGIVARAGNVTLGEDVKITTNGTGTCTAGDASTVLTSSAVLFDASVSDKYATTDDSKITITGGTYQSASNVASVSVVKPTETTDTQTRMSITGGNYTDNSAQSYVANTTAYTVTESSETTTGSKTFTVAVNTSAVPSATVKKSDGTTAETVLAPDANNAFNITDGDYASFSNSTAYTGVTVNYTRTFESVGWYSWFTPFTFTVTDDMLKQATFAYPVAIMNESEDNNAWTVAVVKLKAGETVKANLPYVIKPVEADGNAMTLTISNASLAATNTTSPVDISNVIYKMKFTGSYDSQAYTDGQYALSSNGSGFIPATSSNNRRPFRFFMDLSDNSSNPYSSSTGAKPAFIGVTDFADEATAIRAINSAVSSGDSNEVYDLQGRKVSRPVKGIYIVGGKKVIMK